MDLICYVQDGWDPRVRPASSRRDWMDETPNSFAYRCLPLAMANAHGWEILSPCGFQARWRGGKHMSAIEIKTDPDTPAHLLPISLFGSGVLTFHVHGLFRTPDGWNLHVSGPPNSAKDGIAPLSGVIETDWSPYSFTMNWRFTRPNNWVRFEKDEPIAFFFPVQRQSIEAWEPRIVPLTDAPGLKAEYEAWSKSRDAFQTYVERTKPDSPTNTWQKNYYRGVRPDGSPGATDHQSKLRLPEFAQPEGGCPVRPKPAPELPENLLKTNPGLDLALQRINLQTRKP